MGVLHVIKKSEVLSQNEKTLVVEGSWNDLTYHTQLHSGKVKQKAVINFINDEEFEKELSLSPVKSHTTMNNEELWLYTKDNYKYCICVSEREKKYYKKSDLSKDILNKIIEEGSHKELTKTGIKTYVTVPTGDTKGIYYNIKTKRYWFKDIKDVLKWLKKKENIDDITEDNLERSLFVRWALDIELNVPNEDKNLIIYRCNTNYE